MSGSCFVWCSENDVSPHWWILITILSCLKPREQALSQSANKSWHGPYIPSFLAMPGFIPEMNSSEIWDECWEMQLAPTTATAAAGEVFGARPDLCLPHFALFALMSSTDFALTLMSSTAREKHEKLNIKPPPFLQVGGELTQLKCNFSSWCDPEEVSKDPDKAPQKEPLIRPPHFTGY